jgi:hypothetical protein
MSTAQKTTGHTPGPWRLHNPAADTLAVHYGPNELHSWPTNYTPQDLADAALIAAAPELLEAARFLLEIAENAPAFKRAMASYTNDPDCKGSDARLVMGVHDCRSVISKATTTR